MTDILTTDVRDGVATLTLNRPDARNALNGELLRRIPEVMQALDADDDVGAIVLTGADPSFCAGLDLRELGGGDGLISGVDPQFWPTITKTVIGAVNGPAVTGGLELALQCDFLVASERARSATPT